MRGVEWGGRLFGAVLLAASLAACTPHVQPTPTVTVQEDDPGWNCLTMGNRTCGPTWVPVEPGLADALAEGDAPDATTRDWESCLVRVGETTYVVCPDGWVESS